jgi:uncharacterized peroxidase-related enzyme
MSYLRQEPLDETNFPLFEAVKNQFGFIPNFYRAQTMRPDLIEVEAQLVNAILIKEGALTRKEKEYVFLVCSAANLSTYCVTAHCEIVRMLGIEGPEPERIAVDYATADLPMHVKALLTFAAKLNRAPSKLGDRDVNALRTYGYGDEQILEAVLMVGLAKFANYVSFGLGASPDFDPAKIGLHHREAVGSFG